MIKAYKIRYLSFHTEIKSYTIFGAFCWAYRFLYGNNQLIEFLETFSKNPKFLISSPFPLLKDKPLFPKPLLKLETEENLSIIDKLKRKPYKKASFITINVLKDIIDGNIKTQNDLMKTYNVKGSIIYKSEEFQNKEEILLKYHNIIQTHNLINRYNNITENLYFENGRFTPQEHYFLVQFCDLEFQSKFEEALKFIEDLGIGGNKNIGWGKIEIEPLNLDISFLQNHQSNFFITLSPIIPDKNLVANKSYYNLRTFQSYTEGTFSDGILKNKIIYLEEGSLIYKENSYAGILKKMKNIYQYGLEFPIYLRWNYE
ncbi:MAG: hypothetical protein KatS3mg129_1727 [Leptospiraceae bacterium]|nr:MAG: hypothetical protein KatS3mg129_1727 [Leptospiraceae bacterium]